MSLYILTDQKYLEGMVSNIHNTLSHVSALGKKKIKIFKIDNADNIDKIFNDSNSVLFIPSDLNENQKPLIQKCNLHNTPVITAHSYQRTLTDCYYSVIVGDLYQMVNSLFKYISDYNKEKFCCIGINNNTTTDKNKVAALYDSCPDMKPDDVFFNTSSLSDCFEEFFPHRKKYNCIICANDFVAFGVIDQLKKRDPEYLKNTFIIGFMCTALSHISKESLTSITYDINAVTNAVFSIYRSLSRANMGIISFTAFLYSTINIGESTRNSPQLQKKGTITANPLYKQRNFVFPDYKEPIIPYENDPFVKDYVEVENLISSLKAIDFKIIEQFLLGKKNPEICSNLYISPKTIQYHSKIIFNSYKVKSKKEFISKISRFISLENLHSYICSLQE